MAQVINYKSVLRQVQKAKAAEKQFVQQVVDAQGKNPKKFRDSVKKLFTTDSFQNFALGLGVGTDNALGQSTYGYYPITRIRVLLEWIHRGSWLGGIAVDVVADDMTRAGIDVVSSMEPDEIVLLQSAMRRRGIWSAINETWRWGRLYGGAISVMMIEGQDPSTELRLESIAPGQFLGLLVLDRWLVNPDLQNLVFSPDYGMVPKFYNVPAGTMGLPEMRIHHSRVLRVEGVRLPYQQRLTEMLWGLSVYERLYDRLIAFDSATMGAAQLVYKSFLRYLRIEGMKKIVAEGGPALQGLTKYVDLMRRFQSIEGITMIDKNDEFGIQQHQAFSGISDVLLQFGQQLSGALQIPLVRLFGQSPAGLNSTGESDIRTYYDGITAQQEKMRVPLERIIHVLAKSEKIDLPDDFAFAFRSLWQLNEEEKSMIAERNTNMVTRAFESGVLTSPSIALKELQQQSRITGYWSNITNDDIQAAEEALPNMIEVMQEEREAESDRKDKQVEQAGKRAQQPPPAAPGKKPQNTAKKPKKKTGDSQPTRDEVSGLPLREWHGLHLVIEHNEGEKRGEVVMPAAYGFIRKTTSAEGPDEEMDIFLCGDSDSVCVVDSFHPDGTFDEHKLFLGTEDKNTVANLFKITYGDTKQAKTVSSIGLGQLQSWLDQGDFSKPFASEE